MPYIFETVGKNYSAGDSGEVWNTKVDASLFGLASRLRDAGWNVSYRFPYAIARTRHDFSVSFAPFIAGFFGVFPTNPSPANPVRLIVDHVPDGYVPPPGMEIFAVIEDPPGFGRMEKIHEAVVGAIIQIGAAEGKVLGAIYTDPDDPVSILNTYIEWTQYATDFDDDPHALQQGLGRYGMGVAIGSGMTDFVAGGYAARTAANGEEFNYASIFMSRDEVSGIDAFKMQFFACKEVGSQPLVHTMDTNVDRTQYVRLEINKADYTLAAGPFHCALAQSSDGLNGGITVAALDLPVETSGVTDAAFAGIRPQEGFVTGDFRHGTQVQGFLYMETNGRAWIGQNPGSRGPRVMALWGPARGWFNGMPQISEAWCGFSTGDDPIAPILGKLPGALVINGPLNAFSQPPFQFDGAAWRAFTHNAGTNGAGQRGSIAFRTPEDADPPECT